jgi:hypothetical protein
MAYTLSNLLQDGIALMGNSSYFRSTATGGSATTLVDTSLTEKSEEDLKSGTVVVVRDSAGTSVSPEGKFGVVSSYADATWTITFTPTMTDGVASGDEYMLISPQFPLVELRRIANLALQRAGTFLRYDTSLTTTADATEYSLPVTLKLKPQTLRVFIESHTGDSDDNRWELTNYRVIPGAAGAVSTLVIPQFSAGYTIGIEYETVHPALYAYSDVVDEGINPVLAQLLFATELFAWVGITDDNRDQANKILSDLSEAKRMHKLPRAHRNDNFLSWSR